MYVCMYVTVKLCVLWAGGEVEFMESANPNLIWQKLASEAVRLLCMTNILLFLYILCHNEINKHIHLHTYICVDEA